jgi:hypothetical protein
MNDNALSVYLLTLAVIQPARIQDIEKRCTELFPQIASVAAEKGLRDVHAIALDQQLIVSVRRGVYCLSKIGASSIRSKTLSRQIDNRRLFLMKKERKRI